MVGPSVEKLCKSQTEILREIVASLGGSYDPLPSILLIGPLGSGKKILSKAIAEKLDISFIECPLQSNSEYLTKYLFGSNREARRAKENGQAPGELGRHTKSLIYLSGIQHLNESLHLPFQRLITQRLYLDDLGTTWELSPETLIVASLDDLQQSLVVGSEHWLTTIFQRR